MKFGGVVAVVCMVASLCAADSSSSDNSQKKMLDGLFQGIEHLPVSYLKRFRFIDIESLLEDSPELADQFKSLSEKQKDELIDAIDKFNEILAEGFLHMTQTEQ